MLDFLLGSLLISTIACSVALCAARAATVEHHIRAQLDARRALQSTCNTLEKLSFEKDKQELISTALKLAERNKQTVTCKSPEPVTPELQFIVCQIESSNNPLNSSSNAHRCGLFIQ